LREKDWNVVVLAGPHGEFQPLLDHLLSSPDWRLEALANAGWLFKRERGPSNPLPKPEEVDLGNPLDTAIYLAQLSSRFDAMAAPVAARAAIERALELAPNDAIVRLHAAYFALERERWQDVVSHARAALRTSPASPQAHALAARAYFESGDFDAAKKSATSALAVSPSDLSTRFLLARIQRANRDFRSEAETLERLIMDSKSAGLPTAGYLAYLGQSYAQVGNAVFSAKSYREALASGQLDDEQKQAVREALEIVESRSRGGQPAPEPGRFD
jgi:tetratricopeptide (TPR) repeat protein